MKDKKNIADSIMEKIANKKIVPKARWEFLVKNYFVWGIGIVAALVGGVAFSAVLFAVQNSDWILYQRLSGNLPSHMFSFIPFLWILLLASFVLIAMYQMKHTQRGYTYSVFFLVFVNIAISGVLGVALQGFGYAHVFDTHAGRMIPFYTPVEERREDLWVQPDKGLLAGIVLGTTTDSAFLLQDYKGDVWKVSDELLGEIDLLVLLNMDEVGVVGNKTGTSSFEACAVRPWGIAGGNARLRDEMKQGMLERIEPQRGAPSIGKVPPQETITIPPKENEMMNGVRGKEILNKQMKQRGFEEKGLEYLRDAVCNRVTEVIQ